MSWKVVMAFILTLLPILARYILSTRTLDKSGVKGKIVSGLYNWEVGCLVIASFLFAYGISAPPAPPTAPPYTQFTPGTPVPSIASDGGGGMNI